MDYDYFVVDGFDVVDYNDVVDDDDIYENNVLLTFSFPPG